VSSKSKIVQVAGRVSLVIGLSLLGAVGVAHLHRFVMVRIEMAKFEANKGSTATPAVPPGIKTEVDQKEVRDIGTVLWSSHRVEAYKAALNTRMEPLAVLRISRLNLEVPVLEGTDEFTLNRGVGRIRSTSLPGQSGNIGIAGHRDGFFRSLKNIRTGDTIDLVTISGTDVYVVDRVRITDPADLSVLRPRDKPSLTLVTCYPFYFVGPAPGRYIVEASLQK
jgi:sortase A